MLRKHQLPQFLYWDKPRSDSSYSCPSMPSIQVSRFDVSRTGIALVVPLGGCAREGEVMEKDNIVKFALANLLDEGLRLDPNDTDATTKWAEDVAEIVAVGYTPEDVSGFNSKPTHEEKLEYLGSELLLGMYDK